MLSGFKRVLLGRPRDVLDPGVFHKVSLAAFLAWVGLGADGLSSSAYGPEEAFKALGPHGYLAVAMAGAIALTVFIISTPTAGSSSTSHSVVAAMSWPPDCSAGPPGSCRARR